MPASNCRVLFGIDRTVFPEEIEAQTRSSNGIITHHNSVGAAIRQMCSDRTIIKISVYIGDQSFLYRRWSSVYLLPVGIVPHKSITDPCWVQVDGSNRITDIWSQDDFVKVFSHL